MQRLDAIQLRLQRAWRWLFKQVFCRFGRHDIKIKSADIDPAKLVLPAHCENCAVTGKYDVQYDAFLPDGTTKWLRG